MFLVMKKFIENGKDVISQNAQASSKSEARTTCFATFLVQDCKL